jgi:uncharacterized membrane protein
VTVVNLAGLAIAAWLLYALLSVLSGAVANTLRKVVMRDVQVDVYGATLAHRVISAAVTFCIALGAGGFKTHGMGEHWYGFLLQMPLWGLSTLCIMQANRLIDAVEVTVLQTIGPVVTIATAAVFLGEAISSGVIIGTAVIMAGVLATIRVTAEADSWAGSRKTRTGNSANRRKGFLFALAAAVLGGAGITNDAHMLHFCDPISYLAVSFLLPGVIIGAAAWVFKLSTAEKMLPLLRPSLAWRITSYSAAYAVSASLLFLAIRAGGKASQVAPITQSSVIVSVVFAVIFLKERKFLTQKLCHALVVTFGISFVGAAGHRALEDCHHQPIE